MLYDADREQGPSLKDKELEDGTEVRDQMLQGPPIMANANLFERILGRIAQRKVCRKVILYCTGIVVASVGMQWG